MAIAMSDGVGVGQTNAPIDVAIVQDLLNRAQPEIAAVAVDGLASATLNDRIKKFQANALKSRHPDGKIAPGGPTIRALRDKAKARPMNPRLLNGSATWGKWSTLNTDAFVNLYSLQFDEDQPALKNLMGMLQKDQDVTDIRWAAYMLATAWKEAYDWTAKPPVRFVPIREVGHGRDHRKRDLNPMTAKTKLKFSAKTICDYSESKADYDYGDTITFTDAAGKDHDGNIYYGRGYVQVTWLDRYWSIGRVLGKGETFAVDPDQVLDTATAYSILSKGMRASPNWFTQGPGLSNYIDQNVCDYYHARRIINAMVPAVAREIAYTAEQLEFLLRILAQ